MDDILTNPLLLAVFVAAVTCLLIEVAVAISEAVRRKREEKDVYKPMK